MMDQACEHQAADTPGQERRRVAGSDNHEANQEPGRPSETTPPGEIRMESRNERPGYIRAH